MPPCQTCKLRRVKCDQTLPICLRCTKSRRNCISCDADRKDFTIHSENTFASGKTKRPRGPRSSLTLRRPAVNLENAAVAYYVHDHLQIITGVPNVGQGLGECVASWSKSGGGCAIVDLALSAVSLAVFSRTQRHPPALVEAFSNYYRLLQSIQKLVAQLISPTVHQKAINACLLAAFLMSRYEGTTYNHNGRNGSVVSPYLWSHSDGSIALLKMWYDSPACKMATPIIKQTRKGIIRACLLRGHPIPEWILDGSAFGESDSELDFDHLFVQIVDLRRAVKDVSQQRCVPRAEALDLHERAQDLDQKLDEWVTHLPSTWLYRKHHLRNPGSLPRKHLYSPDIYSCATPGYGAIWCQYFSTRMLLNSTCLKILELPYHCRPVFSLSNQMRRLKCTNMLKQMGESLASAIPSCIFCLDKIKVATDLKRPGQSYVTVDENVEVKGYQAALVIWPLSIAASLEEVDDEQRVWLRSELAAMGTVAGSGVLESANTDKWTFL